MREKLRAFTVKVEDSLADRIELNAAVFSSSSAFLRLMARVFFRMVDDGRIKLQADWLQENLRSNSGNQRNRVASAARSEVADGLPATDIRPPQPVSLSRRKAATVGRALESRSVQPLRFANLNFAGGMVILQ